MEVIKLNNQVKEKTDLYIFLDEVPKPHPKFKLTPSQKFWWHWVGSELIKTGKFGSLDQIHLHTAAIWLDAKTKTLEVINHLNKEDENYGVAGWVQVFRSGASNVTGYTSLIEKADKHLEDLSKHFGLSINDRQKLKNPDIDPNQMDLFKEFGQLKSM